FSESLVAPEFRFNAQYGEDRVPMLNPATWRLKVSGMVSRTTAWTLDELKSLPQRADVTRHVCVEGWSMIGKWSGVPLRTFLERS
ncbi:molybdopterin-dependent oxidoreductase, partial [Staphylococcus aureus]